MAPPAPRWHCHVSQPHGITTASDTKHPQEVLRSMARAGPRVAEGLRATTGTQLHCLWLHRVATVFWEQEARSGSRTGGSTRRCTAPRASSKASAHKPRQPGPAAPKIHGTRLSGLSLSKREGKKKKNDKNGLEVFSLPSHSLPYLLFEKHNLSVYYQEIQTL